MYNLINLQRFLTPMTKNITFINEENIIRCHIAENYTLSSVEAFEDGDTLDDLQD